jgi:hypothetical protein
MTVNSIMDKHSKEMLYLGSIIWNKIPTTKTSGGASVMGSYGRPRNGYVSYNYEYTNGENYSMEYGLLTE